MKVEVMRRLEIHGNHSRCSFCGGIAEEHGYEKPLRLTSFDDFMAHMPEYKQRRWTLCEICESRFYKPTDVVGDFIDSRLGILEVP